MTMKLIKPKPIRIQTLPNSIGKPTATSSLDRRFATGWGRTPAQKMADARKRLSF
jgi:hypothetical protein